MSKCHLITPDTVIEDARSMTVHNDLTDLTQRPRPHSTTTVLSNDHEMACVNRKHSPKRVESASDEDKEEDEEKEQAKCQKEWQGIVTKIDRVLFWVFFALTVICPSIVLIVYSI